MARRALILIAGCSLLAACGRDPSPPPGERITGSERLAWDQQAADAAELASFHYAIYVDGTRSELSDASCVAARSGFTCSARMPPLAPGRHTLELAAFISDLGAVESGKSAPLRVQLGSQITRAIRVQSQLVTNDPGGVAAASERRALVEARSGRAGPSARLVAAPRLVVPGAVDSNVPLARAVVNGVPTLFGFASWGGIPAAMAGASLDTLQRTGEVTFSPHPGHGIWIESVIPDEESGIWYGYYHHEVPASACGRPDRSIPRVGAARSFDRGLTWEDLGIVLEAPPGSEACASANRYVIGGVGDVSAMLDRGRQDVFLFFSQYSKDASMQGVAVARLAWADRDAPRGRVAVWQNGAWLPPHEIAAGDESAWEYPAGTSLVAVSHPWHDASGSVDAFWGPSVHWNTYLERYVMLLNRAKNEYFNNEGIYVSFADGLDDPRGWSAPQKILSGGEWYPQVAGLDARTGTDREAGQRARFFMTGRSDHLIEFTK
jgi:hypothetical protein